VNRPAPRSSESHPCSVIRDNGPNIQLPDHPGLIGELLSLEQRTLPSGRPRFEAPPGGTDDYAHALLALAHHLTSQPSYDGPLSMIA